MKPLDIIYDFTSINTVVDCGTLTGPANGTILLDTTSFGSTVTYSCSNSDHQLVGDAMRTCQANGMWSGSAPTCGEQVDVSVDFYHENLHKGCQGSINLH